jgi:uracil-DNA glycosylase family protein
MAPLGAPPPAPGETPFTCRRCDLWRRATQAVSGEGSRDAAIMLVGEQPGDEEDLRGQPFIGPAGRLLDGALEEAGLTRRAVYITNAVKHFKWELRGKRRLHKKPALREINACNVWLEQEIAAIAPTIIVALGTTALRALTGATLTIAVARGAELRHAQGVRIIASYHPSAILRAQGAQARALRTALIDDLRRADKLAAASAGSAAPSA